MSFALNYLGWHYSTAYRDIGRIWTNYLWFVLHFFSIGLLLRTFASPFRRLSEDKKGDGGINIQAWLERMAINTMMRLVGILVRSITIGVGLIVLVVIIAIGLIWYVIWSLFPAVIIALLWLAINPPNL